jgi:hypothetical protein
VLRLFQKKIANTKNRGAHNVTFGEAYISGKFRETLGTSVVERLMWEL